MENSVILNWDMSEAEDFQYFVLERTNEASAGVEQSTISYELIDIIDPTVWRRHGYVVHPMLSRAPMSYSKGQIIQCDFLYMRHPDKFSTEFSVSSDIVKQKLKAAWIAMSYGYFDRAEDYISDPIVEEFLHDQWKLDWTKDLYDASVKFGKLARKKAINAQLRGLLTFLHNVIRPFPGT